jgi:hypothetical protein
MNAYNRVSILSRHPVTAQDERVEHGEPGEPAAPAPADGASA